MKEWLLCHRPLVGRRRRARYSSESCRAEAWRRRRAAAPHGECERCRQRSEGPDILCGEIAKLAGSGDSCTVVEEGGDAVDVPQEAPPSLASLAERIENLERIVADSERRTGPRAGADGT